MSLGRKLAIETHPNYLLLTSLVHVTIVTGASADKGVGLLTCHECGLQNRGVRAGGRAPLRPGGSSAVQLLDTRE